MKVGGFQKFSLIDYPNQISAVIFTQGCNLKCPYCHNPELLNPDQKSKFTETEIFNFLSSRQNQLDAVVITGGEPTLQKDLFVFIQKIKSLGFLVKLDTNGTKPKIIKNLLKHKLIDYLAMDIKGPIDKYSEITQSTIKLTDILQSIQLVKTCPDYEFRTTITREQLSIADIKQTSRLICGAKKYFLQNYTSQPNQKIIKNKFSPYSQADLLKIIKEIKPYSDHPAIR